MTLLCCRYHDDSAIALHYTSERLGADGVKTKTFGQLRDSVRRLAASLARAGVEAGDRVVGYIPNCPEAVKVSLVCLESNSFFEIGCKNEMIKYICFQAMAATAALGAIWSSTSPDFGVSGVLDRFSQIRPKVVFSVEAVSYNMKTHDHTAKLSQVVNQLDSVEKVVVIPFIHNKEDIDLSQIQHAVSLDEFLEAGRGGERTGSTPS